ncbi:hypothetical protein P153DRAFT_364777 [Dothidotthia symphoricarpi CBS 119687]|uniref:Uncharacterized protein n=1 Tax=Dothidotthia symphoricarpi CBS 119687 TaxID=1392245 RepID=A0A6A6APD7_9PLEO|nr:uncharacterized protein P153DRAFT_364777 [Dothidotthia symphoricarpi CBS 119687]KAF2132371.1 hypothetical protein P153DRAFT_364777 [Dothidotthia symphoricarpi CBS 119687]
MYADQLHITDTVCYFSIPLLEPNSHFSSETPSTSPVFEFTSSTTPDPINPLLAYRSARALMSSPIDASRLLQLQTDAAHRPSPEPLQSSASSISSNNSSSSSSSSGSNSNMPSPRSSISSSPAPCCCRCRREHGHSSMFQFGTNLYYCGHCAKMTGYSVG